MKTIAVIGIKGIPSRASGIEIHAENLYSRLSDKYYITAYSRKRYCNEICDSYKGIHIKYIPSINTKHLDAITYSVFSTICALFTGSDIFHFHALGPASVCWLPHLFKKKVICTVHGLDWKRQKWGKAGKAYLKFGEKMIAKYADEIIVLTEADKKYFKEKWNRDTNIIPNGVEVNKIAKKSRLSKIDADYILFLARLVPEKGVYYLIEAYKKSNCTKKLIIAGGSSHSEEYTNYLHELAKDNENIIFTGRVEGDVLISLYQNASLYVLPSDLEGQPVSLLEAMSFGCLCLASDIDANRETLKEWGIYFKQGDINSLTDKLKDFEKDKFQVNSENQIEYIAENYSWDSIAEKTNMVIKGMDCDR